jgi:ferredoxin-NADP reductase
VPDEYVTTYLGHGGCAPGVETFHLSRPGGYTFRPGQFFQLTIETRDGEQSRYFSHADAPDDPVTEFTTRLTGSAFKDALLALEPGAGVRFRGPMGRLGVPDGVTSVGFLTGGVGITPAHSIIRDAMVRRTGLVVALFYANREPSCIPYSAEFRAYAEADPRFRYVEVVEVPDADWTGPVGYLTADIIRARVDLAEPRHWIVSGPPPMVDAMRSVIRALEVAPEHVSYEQFSSY